MLCTAATFNPGDTTLDGITKTEVATANGYTAGGADLANVAVTTVGTNGAKFTADFAEWQVLGGTITASFGILYNDTDVGDPPLAFIDFDGSSTAGDGTDFLIVWNDDGIFSWSVVP